MTMRKTWTLWSGVFLLTGGLSLPAIAQPSPPPPPLPPAAQPATTEPARQTYQVVYVLTESEDGKFLSSQHAELLVSTRSSTELKLGTKVPLLIGDPGPGAPRGQDGTYIDGGLNIQARISSASDSSPFLKTKVEQSSIEGLEKATLPTTPLVRQATLTCEAVMPEGKPVVLGLLDLPGSNHHLKIEATVTRRQ